MNAIDRERLAELKAEATAQNPDVLKWYDGRDGAYADRKGGGTVSIMLHPREGDKHIRRLGGSTLDVESGSSQGPGPVAPELDEVVDGLIASGDLLEYALGGGDSPDPELLYAQSDDWISDYYDQTNEDDDLSELAAPSDVLAPNEYMELTPRGIEFKTSVIPFDVWESMTISVLYLDNSLKWALGDLLNYGEAKYGDAYAQAMTITGLSYWTLAGLKWITNKIPYSERTPGLSPTPYKLTASLTPEQRAPIIAAYVAEKINTDGIKDAVRALKEPEPEEPTPATAPPPPDFDVIEPDRPEMSAIDPATVNVDELPACPICGGRIGKTKCTKCERTFIDLVWRLHDLQGEILGWMDTGEYGPLLGAMRKDQK